jgi:hypothetical protein
MRSLLFKDITIPVAFKTIPYSRRAEPWEPTCFDRHGPDHAGLSSRVALGSDLRACACDAFRKLVGGNGDAAIRPPIALLITGRATTASKSQVI